MANFIMTKKKSIQIRILAHRNLFAFNSHLARIRNNNSGNIQPINPFFILLARETVL